MITLRSNRILILGFVSLLLTALYFFYPSDHFSAPHAPADPYGGYEAGGIDSDHWRDPIVPKFEKESTRDEDCVDGQCAVGPGGKKGMAGAAGAKERVKAKEDSRKLLAQAQAAVGLPGPVDGKKGDKAPKKEVDKAAVVVDEKTLEGGVIMPKMENETANQLIARAELGRSAWKVLHLMTLRYPETPTADDRSALKSYFHLFARLYPCGECAAEFQSLLKQYPPQTSSRKTASMWLCSVHNMINERLDKPEFDCLTLNEVYDCGCGPEGEGNDESKAEQAKAAGAKVVNKVGAAKDKAMAAGKAVAAGKNKAGAAKEKVVDKAAAGKDKAVAMKDKVAEKVGAAKGKAAAMKDKAKEKIQEVKEDTKDVLKAAQDAVAPPAPAPAAQKAGNRPLGGMNAKEKAGEAQAIANKAKAAAAAAAVRVAEKVKEKVEPKGKEKEEEARPLRKEEIIWNPPQKVKEAAAKAKIAPKPVAEEEEEEQEAEDAGAEGEDGAERELWEVEEEDEVVMTELTPEDAEEAEDDSDMIDGGEGEEAGDEEGVDMDPGFEDLE